MYAKVVDDVWGRVVGLLSMRQLCNCTSRPVGCQASTRRSPAAASSDFLEPAKIIHSPIRTPAKTANTTLDGLERPPI